MPGGYTGLLQKAAPLPENSGQDLPACCPTYVISFGGCYGPKDYEADTVLRKGMEVVL